MYLSRPFDRAFPQLDTLTLDVTVYDAMYTTTVRKAATPRAHDSQPHTFLFVLQALENACLTWPKTPPMRDLYFKVWADPMWHFQLPAVSAIAAAFLTAWTIRLCKTVEWRRRRRSGVGEWGPCCCPRTSTFNDRLCTHR